MKRNRTILLLCTITLTLLQVPGFAQDGDQPQGDSSDSTPVLGGKAAPHTRVPVSVPIEGVSAESAAKLTATILAMRHNVYRCPTCELQSRSAGTCEHCKVEREEAAPSEVMDRVELMVDRRFVSVTLKPHHWGSLNELDSALEGLEARIKRSQFVLPQYSRLLVTGVSDEKAAKRMRYALTDLKVLPSATTVPGPEAGSVWIIPKKLTEGVTVGAVEEALSKMRGEYAIADVQWASYCPTCRVQSTSDMGKPNCRAN